MCSLLFLALVHRHMFADHYPKPCPVLSACGSARPPTTGRNGPWASVRSSDSATWETDFGHNKMGLLCVKWCKYVIICVNRYPHKIPQVTIPLNGEFQADFGDLDGYTTYFGMSGWTDSQTWMFHTYQTCEVKSQTCGSKMINAVTYEGVSWSSQKFWWGYSFSYVPLFRRFLLIGVALPWIMEGAMDKMQYCWDTCNRRPYFAWLSFSSSHQVRMIWGMDMMETSDVGADVAYEDQTQPFELAKSQV